MSTVRLERDGGLAVLTLANPPLNQISEQVIGDLVQAVADLEAADDVRTLLVRGDGDIFSAGADVRLFAGLGADEMRPLIQRFLDLGRRVEALPFPTIAAVHGMCVAGGLELVLFLDLIWAAEGTNLGLLETGSGSCPLPAESNGSPRGPVSGAPARSPSAATSSRPSSSRPGAWSTGCCRPHELQPQAEKLASAWQRARPGPLPPPSA